MGKISIPTTEQPKPQKEPTTTQINVEDTPQEKQEIAEEYDLSDDFLKLYPLKRHFGLDSTSVEYDSMLKDIVEWGKTKGYKTRGEFLSAVRQIEYKIGGADDDMVPLVHRYIKLQKDWSDIGKKLVQLEQYGNK